MHTYTFPYQHTHTHTLHTPIPITPHTPTTCIYTYTYLPIYPLPSTHIYPHCMGHIHTSTTNPSSNPMPLIPIPLTPRRPHPLLRLNTCTYTPTTDKLPHGPVIPDQYGDITSSRSHQLSNGFYVSLSIYMFVMLLLLYRDMIPYSAMMLMVSISLCLSTCMFVCY